MTGPVVFVEPATEHAGHWQDAVIKLATAATAQGHQTVVVTLNGIPGHIHDALREHGIRVAPRTEGPSSRFLALLGGAAHRTATAARCLLPHRRLPHQITLLARCLIEAASLRTAHHTLGRSPEVAVVLTASEALHGLTRALSRTRHLRVVHEVITTEDGLIRALGRLTRPGEVTVLCPTAAVQGEISILFPDLNTDVHPFALAIPEDRITADERTHARRALAIPQGEPVLCLVGGWWPHKDMATVAAALERLTRPLHVLVAGGPTDPVLMHQVATAPNVTLHTRPGSLTPADIRQVYAASDFTAVIRHPGVGKESGLVADCARLGVPLLLSDHDRDLTSRVHGWAVVVPPRDPAALAYAIDHAATHPPSMPPLTAAEDLGLCTPAQMLALFRELSDTLAAKEPTP
ncbi:glycosyltransferase [Nocardiopsis sp. YSL2]|uniref:glycosyltransferase n=1 Tax=Nocardiopsis sp. YSL2 TaxID=2939492 RepID=UPI0026F45035|nr:glycosyltransferase [Nocardiopsis sp. YSL2]